MTCSLESLQNFYKLNYFGGAFGYIVMNYLLIPNRNLFKRPINWNFFRTRWQCFWSSFYSGSSYWFLIRNAKISWRMSWRTTLTLLRNLPNIEVFPLRMCPLQIIYKWSATQVDFYCLNASLLLKNLQDFFPHFLRASETLLCRGQAYSLIKCNQISGKNSTLWSRIHANVFCGNTSSHRHARISKLDS